MPLPVTVYRWDDAGAPQNVNNTPSEIIEIFRACLVSGYGAKAGAGWTVAFEDAGVHKIAFQNDTTNGSGGFVQIWSNTGDDLATSSVVYRAAAGMSGLDSFIRNGFTNVIKGNLGSSQIKDWMIVATSVSFYFFSMQSSLTTNYKGYYSIFVGDFDSFIENDAGRFVGCAGQVAHRTFDSTISPADQALFYTGLNFKPILYESDGSSNYIQGSATQYFTSISPGDSDALAISDVDANVTINLIDCLILGGKTSDSAGTKCMQSKLQPSVRGKLPGLFESSYTGYHGVEFPHIRTLNGQQHILCPAIDKRSLKFWLNIEEWY